MALTQAKLLDVTTLPADHPALVPDLWGRSMLGHPLVTPAARAAALQAAGLSPQLPGDGALKLTQAHEVVILETLCAELRDPAFGARAGIAHDALQRTILTYMLFSAARLGDMLALVSRYLPVTRIRSRLQTSDADGAVRVDFDYGAGALAAHPQYGDFIMGAVVKTMRTAIGGPVPVDWVSVCDPRRLAPGVMESILGCPMRRDLSGFAMQVPRTALDLPVATADARLLEHLTAYGDILLERRNAGPATTRDEVERLILPRLSFGAPGIEEIAADMGLSPRTLSRRLEREGSSYRAVLEDLRYSLARHYLADRGLPLAEIAFLLGFADQSGFGTAFRRWAGFTPGQYRQTL